MLRGESEKTRRAVFCLHLYTIQPSPAAYPPRLLQVPSARAWNRNPSRIPPEPIQ